MSTLEELKAVRELLSDPEHWTRGAFARDAQGGEISPASPEAACWCIGGAAMYMASEPGWDFIQLLDASLPVLRAVGDVIGCTDVGFIGDWQDAPDRTHAEVLDALDRAIAAEEDVDG